METKYLTLRFGEPGGILTVAAVVSRGPKAVNLGL